MPIEIRYLIWIALIGVLFKYWNNLHLSILNFAEYKINKSIKNSKEKRKITNIIIVSTIFLFIASLIGFYAFFNKITINFIRVIIFLVFSLILTYTLTIVFNILNMKQRKKDWVIDKNVSYKEFLKILKEDLNRKNEKGKEKLHNKIKFLKEKSKK